MRYIQQVHKECGGEIVAVSDGKSLHLACRKCQTLWEMPKLYRLESPDEFVDGVER